MEARKVEIGSVRSVNPARRELRIQAAGGPIPADMVWVYVADAEGRDRRCRVERVHGDTVTLAAGVTRDTVAGMRGAAVYADVGAEAEPDWQDLLAAWQGFDVIDETGVRLGTVVAVYATHANGAIEVAAASGESWLLPAIDRVIAAVDMERNVVTVKDIAPYTVESKSARSERR